MQTKSSVPDLESAIAPLDSAPTPIVSLTPDQLSEIIRNATLAGIQQGTAQAKPSAEPIEEQAAEPKLVETKLAKVKAVKSTWPFGNKDEDKKFNLDKLTSLTELPVDKYVIAIPAYNVNSTGEKIGFDLKNTQIQFRDRLDHDQDQKTDKSTGASIYQLLGIEPIVLHNPFS